MQYTHYGCGNSMLVFLQVASVLETLGPPVIKDDLLIAPTHPLAASQPPEVASDGPVGPREEVFSWAYSLALAGTPTTYLAHGAFTLADEEQI